MLIHVVHVCQMRSDEITARARSRAGGRARAARLYLVLEISLASLRNPENRGATDHVGHVGRVGEDDVGDGSGDERAACVRSRGGISDRRQWYGCSERSY